MRCLIVGLGSIGRRRARILSEMGHEVRGFDMDRALAREVLGEGRGAATLGIGLLMPRVDAAFICTPAAHHVGPALDCVDCGVPVFVEKPLSLWNDGGLTALVQASDRLVTMGACNMRWAYAKAPHKDRARLTLDLCKPLSSWRDGAAAAYRPNGLILEAAIHEMDVAVSRLGPIFDVTVWGDEERASVRIDHQAGCQSMVHASWAEGDDDRRCLFYAGTPMQLPDTSDEMYRLEMAHFLECVREGKPTCNPIRNAAHVLEWAIKAQEQIRTGVTA